MITAEELRKLFHYDPETGRFTRLRAASNFPAGSIAGRINHLGYCEIRIKVTRYQAHRLAWLYVHGEWPPGDIDHINRDRSDNRICNLRPATRAQNLWNITAKRNSTTGIKGVSFHRASGKYRAVIRDGKKRRHLGLFGSVEEAAAAYNSAAVDLHGEFACKN